VVGTFNMSHVAAPALIKAGARGRIINVTTSLATMQRKTNSPYGVSKVAIEAETLIWAKDLEGTGVTVNTVLPGGATDTDFVSAGLTVSAAPCSTGKISPSKVSRDTRPACALTFIAAINWPAALRTGTAIERRPISNSSSTRQNPSARTRASAPISASMSVSV